MKKLLILALIWALPFSAFATCVPVRTGDGKIKRSSYQALKFRKTHACPATGTVDKSCPGFIIDHIVPLCACGPDLPSNMQWQTLAASDLKNIEEDKLCASLK